MQRCMWSQVPFVALTTGTGEPLGTDFIAKGASASNRLLDAAILLLYTSLCDSVRFTPCYPTGKSLYDAQ